MERVKIGYVPTRRNVFSKEDAIRFRHEIKLAIERFKEVDLIDIDELNQEGLLYDEKDLPLIIQKMKSENVDGLFFPHCNFGTEDLVAKVARAIQKPVLLWGPRDDAPLNDGSRTRDTQCGLFATGKVLRRFKVPFTYIENSRITDNIFLESYINFAGVCSVIKNLSCLNVLQIGPRPDGFWSVICNEGELIERFDFHIFPISLVDLKNEVDSIMQSADSEYENSLNQIYKLMQVEQKDYENVKKAAALKVAIKRLCKSTNVIVYLCSAGMHYRAVWGLCPAL